MLHNLLTSNLQLSTYVIIRKCLIDYNIHTRLYKPGNIRNRIGIHRPKLDQVAEQRKTKQKIDNKVDNSKDILNKCGYDATISALDRKLKHPPLTLWTSCTIIPLKQDNRTWSIILSW